MTRRAARRRGLHGPNMTPMVDVVLVILIFFMAAMGIAVREQYLRTGVPPPREAKASASAAPSATPSDPASIPASRAALRMQRESGRTVVSGLGMERAPLGEITRRLADFKAAGASSSVIVVVIPAGDVPYQDVVIVHDACAGAGIANVRLGVIGE